MNRPHLFADAPAAAAACGDFILDLLRRAIAERGRSTIAVSGGHTPQLLFQYMSKADFPWEKLDFFFVDERAVPPENKDSNYRLANENLLVNVKIPRRNIHRIEGELEPVEAARIYTETILEFFGLRDDEIPVFDVIQHGMGPDGHTASLFPGDRLIADRTGIASAVRAPAPPVERVTLLPAVLLSSRETIFLLDGKDKRDSLQEVLTGELNPKKYPSQLLSRSGKQVDWFVAGIPDATWPQ